MGTQKSKTRDQDRESERSDQRGLGSRKEEEGKNIQSAKRG